MNASENELSHPLVAPLAGEIRWDGHMSDGVGATAVSVGGTLTHFAAPPVLMVAAPWKWDTPFAFLHFGWKACIGIVVATTIYYVAFRGQLAALEKARSAAAAQTVPRACFFVL